MKNKIFLGFTVLILFIISNAQASVVMTGTRIIFPSTANEKVIQLKNMDEQPYIIQLQLTTENNEIDNNAPFTLLPPLFRMEPNTGQSIRLLANQTEKLPKDKESIFYLNFTQLPTLKEKNENQLVIAVTNRIKIYYRPIALVGKENEAYDSLNYHIKDGQFIVNNPTGYYITIRKAELITPHFNIVLAEAKMLSPQSITRWELPEKITTLNNASLKLILVNDYGADFTREKYF